MNEYKLTKIKHCEFASQETECFKAVITRNGKPWAAVFNEGHGGPNGINSISAAGRHQAFIDEEAEFEKWCADRLPADDSARKYAAEHWVNEQLELWLDAKQMTKILNRSKKRGPLWRFKGEPDGHWHQFTKRYPDMTLDRMLGIIQKWHQNDPKKPSFDDVEQVAIGGRLVHLEHGKEVI